MQSQPGTIGSVARHLKKGGRTRALNVILTELGRAYSFAAQAPFDRAADVLPGLKKQWRRSGKVHSRPENDAIDGQVRAVDAPFDVAAEQLMFPRDPRGSAKNTINCDCASLPFMESWEVQHPGPKPFTPDELAASPTKRMMREVAAGG